MTACALCGAEIPNKSKDALIDEGYNFAELFEFRYWFCPEHSAGEVSRYIKKIVEGRLYGGIE